MKKLISLATLVATCGLGGAQAQDQYPISAALTTGLTTNTAELRPIQYSDPGFVQGTLSANVFYLPIEALLLSGSFSLFKNIDPGQEGQGTVGATAPGRTQIQDLSLSADYTIGSLGPASFTAGMGVTVPLSESSRAVGLVTALSPNVTVQFTLPANIALQLIGGATYNFNQDPTQRLDCTDARFYNNCQVSGGDLGNPNSLFTYGGAFVAIFRPLKGMVLNATYSISAGIGAVEFPNNEGTPVGVGAQDDTQYSAAMHGTRFGISYSLSGLSGSADTPDEINPNIDPSLQVAGDQDSPFWTRFTLSLTMATRDLLYARDRSEGVRVTAPIYDFETLTGERTTYSLGISYNL